MRPAAPMPLVEVRTVPVPGLPDGEVLVRSPTQMLRYFGQDESPIDAEGWLHTGDLGRVDEDGYLWITGRTKEIIIRGGENIAPAAVEAALMARTPAWSRPGCSGSRNAEFGEEVDAAVVVEGSPTAEDLRESVRADGWLRSRYRPGGMLLTSRCRSTRPASPILPQSAS